MSLRLCALLLNLASVSAGTAADQPNILWLSIEDASPHLGCYGDKHACTPNVDAFAAESILYENAFVCAPVCAPCRSSIITGVYPTSLGTHHMRSTVKLPPEIRPFTVYLRDAGYYCTNNSKEDYQFRTPKGTWNESSDKAHWRNRPDNDQPFFAVFNYTGTHESVVRGDQPKYDRTVAELSPDELHDPTSLELPPYYPDTPKVREDWARYYNCMTAMDQWFAKQLGELQEAGLADDTIVFFWSDHGVGLPRGKRWLYDSGIHVPLIVHVPEKWRAQLPAEPPTSPGTKSDELVSLIDLPPTVLNLAGLAIPTYMQGRAFLGEHLLPEREYVYAARDRMDERYDMSRTIRTKRYKYIRNFMPWRPYAQWLSYAEQNGTMQELRRLAAEGKLTQAQALFMCNEKPVEEFYDLENDPHELNNLASDAAQSSMVRDLRFEVERQMLRTKDLGLLSESELDHLGDQADARYLIFSTNPRLQLRLTAANSNVTLDDRFEVELERINDDAEQLQSIWRASFCNSRYPDVRRWAMIASVRQLLPVWQSAYYPKAALGDDATVVQVAAAEQLPGSEQRRAMPVLLDAFENAESPWDRLQAANVIDLLPEFDEHADELKPVVERVRENLKDATKTGPAEHRQSLGFVERCIDRLADRLEL